LGNPPMLYIEPSVEVCGKVKHVLNYCIVLYCRPSLGLGVLEKYNHLCVANAEMKTDIYTFQSPPPLQISLHTRLSSQGPYFSNSGGA
jgi:hypothetical protein